MSDKQEAIVEISEIMKRHNLSIDELTTALSAGNQAKLQKSSILSRVFAYIGGILIFCGLSAFVGMFWEDLGSAGRIICTFVPGIITFWMGIAAAQKDSQRKNSVPLFLISSVLEPAGILVALSEMSTGSDERYGLLLMCLVMLIQHVCTLSVVQVSTLVFTSLFFGTCAFFISSELLDISFSYSSLVAGASLTFLCYGLSKTRHAVITPIWYFAGSTMFLAAYFDKVKNTFLEISFLGIAIVLLILSVNVRSRALLLVSTCAMIGYIGYFTAEHFSLSLGWPLTLILMGLFFIGIGSFAIKINNKYLAPAQKD